MKKNLFNTVLLVLVTVFFLTGCAEPRYYNQHHQHSPRYYQRHHQSPPSGVGVDLDIHN